MYLAYSSLQEQQQQTPKPKQEDDRFTLRYKAYLAVCQKYSSEIAAIQKYLPGWTSAIPQY